MPTPLFKADRIDLTVEWRALLHGALVGEMELFRPTVELVAGQTPAPARLPEEMDWAKRLVELYPFDFDRVAIHEGEIHFRAPQREPPVDVALHDVTIEARNLTNSRELSATRPAHVTLEARAERSGRVAAELEGGTAEALENEREEQLAARVPLHGSFEKPVVGVWGALVSLFENGYVETLRPRIELLRDRARG